MEIGELLDAATKARKIGTDMALADALGVGRAAVSTWRHGTRLPDPVACAALADMAGLPLSKVLGVVGEARAISREEKAVWKRLASAAAVFLLVGAIPLPGQSGEAAARPGSASISHIAAGTAYYVRRMHRLARFLRAAFLTTRTRNVDGDLLALPC